MITAKKSTEGHQLAKTRCSLYPLRFDPLYQYRLWGGRRLGDLFRTPPSGPGPIGEAWVLSDRDDHASLVADGALEGWTIAQLMSQFPEELMGRLAGRFDRFPLLLKFLDARQVLSVQVHPHGENGKTEAWVVLESGAKSVIYAGLKNGASCEDLRQAIEGNRLAERLKSFHPLPGDAVFIPGCTVHCLGGDVVVFEIQQNSDTTYRLYDWDHVDPQTGNPRPLQITQAFASVLLAPPGAGLVSPLPDETGRIDGETLFDCEYFKLTLMHLRSPFAVGASGVPTVLVCVDGVGKIDYAHNECAMAMGDVFLLPAETGECLCLPDTALTVLEIGIPE